MQGAIAGMITGLVFTASYILYFKYGAGQGHPEQYWFGISPEGVGTLGMLFNFAVSLVVMRFTPAPPAEVQEIVEDIRVPRGAGQAKGH
jgi:cation/acetate symporter